MKRKQSKESRAAYAREYRRLNKKKLKRIRKLWNAKNRSKRTDYMRKYRAKLRKDKRGIARLVYLLAAVAKEVARQKQQSSLP